MEDYGLSHLHLKKNTQVELQKEVKYNQIGQIVKKGVAHAKKAA